MTRLPEERIGDVLRLQGRKLATAESCSGGLVAHRLTNVPGSSDYYLGGVVAYSNALKASVLGVDAAVLEREGAVSEAVAIAMASGARERFRADIALAVTGIAGPGGGTADKPVGLVYMAVATAQATESESHVFGGDRAAIKAATADRILAMALEWLE